MARSERTGARKGLRYDVVIVGGGTAGVTVAARTRRMRPELSVALIEPSEKHFYQPIWTLVGAGEAPREASWRSQKSVIPPGVTWLQDAVTEFAPEEHAVLTRYGRRVEYRALVAAPGIQLDWDAIPGLRESLGKDGVCSNYSYDAVERTWEFLRGFRGGTAIFTQPGSAIKCAGAPQKIAYLADDYFRRSGVREKTQLIFASGMPSLFAVAHYAPALEAVMRRKGIDARYRHELAELRPDVRQAVFRRLDTEERVVLQYDLLHVTPPQSAPDFVKRSPLAGAGGWIDVDPHTLQHRSFASVFSLGDASSAPTSKTGAAVRKQAPVVVENLLAFLDARPLPARYDGYASCPLVTGYGKLILAEFDYEKLPRETFPVDQRKERWSLYMAKKHVLPRLYWDRMLKGLF
ncbi:MAG: FAD/NAD(P)-binding oxidoreductase [Armatimonadota bacterium]